MSTPRTVDFTTFTSAEMNLLRAARRLFDAMKAEPARTDGAAHKVWRTKITEEAVRDVSVLHVYSFTNIGADRGV